MLFVYQVYLLHWKEWFQERNDYGCPRRAVWVFLHLFLCWQLKLTSMKTVRNIRPSYKTTVSAGEDTFVSEISVVWGWGRRTRRTGRGERKWQRGEMSFQYVIAPCYLLEICLKFYFEKYGHPMHINNVLINYNNQSVKPVTTLLYIYVQAFLMKPAAAWVSFI
jgi:hypothetical protein